jgi:hypothetical protein
VAPISVVAELAAYVDELLAEHWEDPGLTLAIARNACGDPLDVIVVPIDEQPMRSVAAVHAEPSSAGCISALGTATKLEPADAEPVPVRVTAVVGCCETVVLLRHRDGRVQPAVETAGPMVELLRNWAYLVPCPHYRQRLHSAPR